MKRIIYLFIGISMIGIGFYTYVVSAEVKPIINAVVITLMGGAIIGWNLAKE